MLILALDSSTRLGSVALVRQRAPVAEYTLSVQRTHAERLLPAVAQVLRGAGCTPADLEALAVTRGPGSFTGLRIALATAKGLAYALNRPVVGVSTLEALAYGVSGWAGFVCPLLDARRGEAYAAVYRTLPGGGVERSSDYLALPVPAILDRLDEVAPEGRVAFVGDAVPLHRQLLQGRLGERAIFPGEAVAALRASWVGALAAERLERGESDPLDRLVPLYVRPPEAEVRWAERQGKEGEPVCS
ncbi:MAG: tRNA (adenosine(37)-N6)-threonylcarbamoyltransferase complex dimerization subunit type 1 TsaB [Bacillota bacterium]|nr:tRNA (adenosine(37)-N6)-threonylcarbamoyltransferase complex dimerization subunit type 1 TsaB [Bacillota bacterium]